jgi:Amt family ammonium transporter
METSETLDILWMTLCCVLVLLMQAGFLCLESGVTRSKNAINVAMKNAADFVVAVFLFWLFGFGLMFGGSYLGWVGGDYFAYDIGQGSPWISSFFLFQAMFCATTVTIVSGTIAERVQFSGYLLLSILVAAVIYPISGHWAWGGAMGGDGGWLANAGFVDFAGSTVVHSVGGWVALATLLFVGPRQGRFVGGEIKNISGSNAPLAFLGVLFFVMGWIGFNGGSTLAINEQVPGIIANTILAAVAGSIVAYLACKYIKGMFSDQLTTPFNGCLAGLVSITASCHAVSSVQALIIGAIGAAVMLWADQVMLKRKLDDAVGAIPVHLCAGIWGTIAVALFGSPEILGTGLSFWAQLKIQLLGIITIGLWSFLAAMIFIYFINRWKPLRVSVEDEQVGLNVSEHGARTDLIDLLNALDDQQKSADPSSRVPVEPFTEVGQIAERYNQVMEAFEGAVMQTRSIVRDIRDGIATFGQDGLLTSFNPGAEQVFGLSSASAIGRPVVELLHEDSLGKAPTIKQFLDVVEIDKTVEKIGRRQDSEPFHMEVTVTQGASGEESQYTAVFRDINDKKQVEELLFQEQERALVTLGSIVDGVITTDAEGNVVFLNDAAEQFTGWSMSEAHGQSFSSIYKVTSSIYDHAHDIVKTVLRGRKVEIGVENQTLYRRDGKEFAVNHSAAPIKDSDGRVIGVVVVFHDVTIARDMQQQLSHQASHDVLTGMLNRSAFEEEAKDLIRQARLYKETHILGYLDLDQFKLVNDTCGHVAGDELLKQVGALLKNLLRSGDIIARLGGDEFGILLRNCGKDPGINIAENIREEIQQFRFPWGDRQFSIGVSIGLVQLNSEAGSLQKLLSLADSACYAAKDAGRNRVHLYQPDDQELAERRGQMQWVSKIRKALDQDRFRLYFQAISPIEELSSRSGHYEIFIRMIDDDGKIIPPGAFIPAAERYNLIQEIDLWVVRNALAWMGDQIKKNIDSLDMCAINLSGASLGDETCQAEVLKYIKQNKVPGHKICFEITETAAISNIVAAQLFITELKSKGCMFALDDFGSGLSSFAYLKNLPVDYLKIDGAFIKEIDKNSMDSVMVQAINTIGHEMGLKTIAEFVESQAIVDHLKIVGVDYVQGYYVDKPSPLEELDGVVFMPR